MPSEGSVSGRGATSCTDRGYYQSRSGHVRCGLPAAQIVSKLDCVETHVLRGVQVVRQFGAGSRWPAFETESALVPLLRHGETEPSFFNDVAQMLVHSDAPGVDLSTTRAEEPDAVVGQRQNRCCLYCNCEAPAAI